MSNSWITGWSGTSWARTEGDRLMTPISSHIDPRARSFHVASSAIASNISRSAAGALTGAGAGTAGAPPTVNGTMPNVSVTRFPPTLPYIRST